MNAILAAYIECALWSSIICEGDESSPYHDKDGDSFDDHFGIYDLSPECLEAFENDVRDFCAANEELLAESGLDDGQIGHDFWLTRNGHGAGFWDRGLGEVGKKLSEAVKVYGGVDLWIGEENGKEVVCYN